MTKSRLQVFCCIKEDILLYILEVIPNQFDYHVLGTFLQGISTLTKKIGSIVDTVRWCHF